MGKRLSTGMEIQSGCHCIMEWTCRESPFIIVGAVKYVFESAMLVPINPEPAPKRPVHLDREVDVIPLVDTDRDVQVGIWGLNKGTLSSPEGWGKIYLPTVVPEEYTLSATVELPASHQGDYGLTFGLMAGKSYFQFTSTEGSTGLDMIDGQRWDHNETRLAAPMLKPGVPVTVDCTVTKDRIRVEAGGRRWSTGEAIFSDCRSPEWALADGSRIFLGSTRPLRFRDIKIGPPVAPPKLSEYPPLSVGTPLDLLTIIDPSRDAYAGMGTGRGRTALVAATPITTNSWFRPTYQMNTNSHWTLPAWKKLRTTTKV